jgi:hypothetical protein
MPKRHDNTIHKLFFGIKKIIKIILSSITRIRPIVYIEDPKEAPGVDYIYIEDTEVKKTTVVDIITTTHSIRSDVMFTINLNASQASI